jgi:hypothetical protein
VADYRAYTVGSDGHFIDSRLHSCENDAEAIAWVEQIVDERPIELWRGARFITKVKPKDK